MEQEQYFMFHVLNCLNPDCCFCLYLRWEMGAVAELALTDCWNVSSSGRHGFRALYCSISALQRRGQVCLFVASPESKNLGLSSSRSPVSQLMPSRGSVHYNMIMMTTQRSRVAMLWTFSFFFFNDTGLWFTSPFFEGGDIYYMPASEMKRKALQYFCPGRIK